MKQKSNRQRVNEYLKSLRNPPKTGVMIVMDVNADGEIVGDTTLFEADKGHVDDYLEGEALRHIPSSFINGWIAGRGLRRKG